MAPEKSVKTKPKVADRPSRGSVFDKLESRKSFGITPDGGPEPSTWDISNSFLFNLADKDGNGTLDREEFDRVYAHPPPPPYLAIHPPPSHPSPAQV